MFSQTTKVRASFTWGMSNSDLGKHFTRGEDDTQMKTLFVFWQASDNRKRQIYFFPSISNRAGIEGVIARFLSRALELNVLSAYLVLSEASRSAKRTRISIVHVPSTCYKCFPSSGIWHLWLTEGLYVSSLATQIQGQYRRRQKRNGESKERRRKKDSSWT